jgi:hypothetical protein
MLALFLNHPPMFVTGEIALCLSLALFVGALIAAMVRKAFEISQLREAGHSNTTIVRQSLAETVYARPNVPRPATASRAAPLIARAQTNYAMATFCCTWRTVEDPLKTPTWRAPAARWRRNRPVGFTRPCGLVRRLALLRRKRSKATNGLAHRRAWS